MSEPEQPRFGNPLHQPHLRRFAVLLTEMNRESPRGLVLTTTALIDEHLRECIEARLVDHSDVSKLTSGFNAPLGTFSARIIAALGLGLIDENEFRDLQIIRAIRNDFAHKIEVSFETPSIRDRCANLKMKAGDYGSVVVTADQQFSTAAVALIMRLTNRAAYARERRLTTETWPY